MDIYGFYTGKIFNAYEWLGTHITNNGVVFRLFAPNAKSVSIIGDFNNWNDTSMQKIYDGNFYEYFADNAEEGMKYKFRIYEKSGRFIDRSDPYGFSSEARPQNASVIYNTNNYQFNDTNWLRYHNNSKKSSPMNIYELHLGSWKNKLESENDRHTYRSIAKPLVNYVLAMNYNYIEIMPICEYPADASWGYQATGFFCPTSRYGNPDDLKFLIDYCHQNKIGVILDLALAHFAVDDFGLSLFDGAPLYEYPHNDVAYNEWGSKNFNFSRGDVRSFLQSSTMYWLKEFHFDGIRMDAVRNIIYWQGDTNRGINISAIEFLKAMNNGLKELMPKKVLIAEDSSAYPNLTKPIQNGGLGFDYKWDLGWMNDTLEYFKEDTFCRIRDYHKLTFSMHYFYNENYLLPLSHDETVHGKATILQKMNGEYENKFAQARAFYMYMFAHPGKKLNFMGNEIGQLREWDETREQDWDILKYPAHDSFREFHKELNKIYLKNTALYELDFDKSGFEWLDCKEGNCVYSFIRHSKKQSVLAVFNFSDIPVEEYTINLEQYKSARLILDSNWECFGGNIKSINKRYKIKDSLSLRIEEFSGKLFHLA